MLGSWREFYFLNRKRIRTMAMINNGKWCGLQEVDHVWQIYLDSWTFSWWIDLGMLRGPRTSTSVQIDPFYLFPSTFIPSMMLRKMPRVGRYLKSVMSPPHYCIPMPSISFIVRWCSKHTPYLGDYDSTEVRMWIDYLDLDQGQETRASNSCTRCNNKDVDWWPQIWPWLRD